MAEEEVKIAIPRGQVKAFDVGTTPIQVLGDNPRRIVWSAKNLGTAHVFYGYRRDVASSGFKQGWRIDSGGGSVIDEWWTGNVWMISESGTQRVIVEEQTGEEVRPFRIKKG